MQDQHTFRFRTSLTSSEHPPTPLNISIEVMQHLQNAFCYRSVFLWQTSPPPPFLSLHHLRNATQTSQHNSITSIYYMCIIYGQCYKHTQNVNTSSQKSTTPEQISLMLSLHHPPWKRVSAEEDTGVVLKVYNIIMYKVLQRLQLLPPGLPASAQLARNTSTRKLEQVHLLWNELPISHLVGCICAD